MKTAKVPVIDISTHHILLDNIHEHCINIPTREVYLHASINEKDGDCGGIMDFKMATMFIKNMNYLRKLSSDPIIIHQMSPGGEWTAGMSIFNVIDNTPCPTILMVHGMAYSMASITMQAATARLLQPDSEFMVHFGWAGSFNTSIGAIEEARAEQIRNQRMLEIYANRCIDGEFFKQKRMKLNDVISYIDNRIKQTSDWYMTSSEAVYYGFADGIAGDDENNQDILQKVQNQLEKKCK